MSKASSRHAKRGVDNRKFAGKLATKKELNRAKQEARHEKNLELLRKLADSSGFYRQRGETPSRALRRYRREQDGVKLSEARAEAERGAAEHAAKHEAFLKSLGSIVDAAHASEGDK